MVKINIASSISMSPFLPMHTPKKAKEQTKRAKEALRAVEIVLENLAPTRQKAKFTPICDIFQYNRN